MNCHVCGGTMLAVETALPFKIQNKGIVVLKSLPVWQCENCQEYLIEDGVMARVEHILVSADTSVELEVIRYAA